MFESSPPRPVRFACTPQSVPFKHLQSNYKRHRSNGCKDQRFTPDIQKTGTFVENASETIGNHG